MAGPGLVDASNRGGMVMPTEIERLATLEEQMNRVEEGVANFRQFQTDARDFFSRADERAENEKDFHNLRDKENAKREGRRWKLAGFVLAFLTLVIAVLTYLEANRQIHGNLTTAQPGTAVSSSQQPQQDAGEKTW